VKSPFVRLGDIAEQVRGVTYGKADAIDTEQEGYLPILRAGNITDFGVFFGDFVYVPAENISLRQKLLCGDVLVATSSGSLDVVGKAAPLRENFDGSFGAFCKVLRPNQGRVDARYFAHYFKTKEYRRTVSSLAAGANINNLRNEHLDELLVPLPPLPEQRRIAAILDQADALRAKRREALAQLDRLTQAIFVEMFGDFKKDPKRWPVAPLGDLATDMKIGLVRSSEAFGEDAEFDTPYVRMNAIGRAGDFLPELVQRTSVTPKELSEYRLQVGDILFNTRNSKELVGKTAIFREAGDYVYNNNLMRIRFDQRVNAEYAAQCILTPFVQHELEMRKSGTTNVFAIYGRELNTLPVPFPPLELQQKFAARVAAIQETKSRMQTANSEALRLFIALQHRAFRGEL